MLFRLAGIDQNAMRKRGVDYVRDKLQLRAEYQTLSRLPRTRQILFTVRVVMLLAIELHTPHRTQGFVYVKVRSNRLDHCL